MTGIDVIASLQRRRRWWLEENAGIPRESAAPAQTVAFVAVPLR